MPYKHADVMSFCRTHIQKLGMVAHTCNPNSQPQEGGDRLIPAGCVSVVCVKTSLECLTSSRSVRDPILKVGGGDGTRRIALCSCTHACTHALTMTWTDIHTHRGNAFF